MFKKSLALAILAAISGSAFAQQAKVDETIEIKATRTSTPQSAIPATVSVIEGEELRQQLSVAESLSDILGN